MTTPAVRPIVALTYASAIDDPARFKSSKAAGPHFALTPKKYQSGEPDRTGRISKIGDAAVREALYQAAHIMLSKAIEGCSELKSWAMRIARRAGMRKAKVALARKLAVILHRMLADGKAFNPTASANNLWPISRAKLVLRRFDHAAIYLMIAGTYTPFIAQMEIGPVSVGLLIGVWLVAIVGVTLKVLLRGRLDRLAVVLYLLLGWSGAVFYEPVATVLPSLSLWLLAVGGILYSIGVIFHVW